MISGFTAEALISIINSFIDENDNAMQWVNKLILIWIITLILVVVTMFFSFFLKESKALIFSDNKFKEPIKIIMRFAYSFLFWLNYFIII